MFNKLVSGHVHMIEHMHNLHIDPCLGALNINNVVGQFNNSMPNLKSTSPIIPFLAVLYNSYEKEWNIEQ